MRLFFFVISAGLTILSGGCGQTQPTMAGGRPVEYWVQALQDPDAKVRKRAASKLGNVGAADPVVVPALAKTLNDREPHVRAEAALGLLRIGPAAQDALPALEEAARKDSDVRVRTYAAKAVAKIQGR